MAEGKKSPIPSDEVRNRPKIVGFRPFSSVSKIAPRMPLLKIFAPYLPHTYATSGIMCYNVYTHSYTLHCIWTSFQNEKHQSDQLVLLFFIHSKITAPLPDLSQTAKPPEGYHQQDMDPDVTTWNNGFMGLLRQIPTSSYFGMNMCAFSPLP